MTRRPGPVRIRRAGPQDASQLAGRHRALFDSSPDPQALHDYLADPHNLFLFATVDGTGAGFPRGTTLGQIRSRRRQFFLYEIEVVPTFRRTGVARALIRHLLRYCRQHRYEEVFVLTSPANRAAVRLYRGTGGRPETAADRMIVYRLRPVRPSG